MRKLQLLAALLLATAGGEPLRSTSLLSSTHTNRYEDAPKNTTREEARRRRQLQRKKVQP